MYKKILEMKFIEELLAGTLDRSAVSRPRSLPDAPSFCVPQQRVHKGGGVPSTIQILTMSEMLLAYERECEAEKVPAAHRPLACVHGTRARV